MWARLWQELWIDTRSNMRGTVLDPREQAPSLGEITSCLTPLAPLPFPTLHVHIWLVFKWSLLLPRCLPSLLLSIPSSHHRPGPHLTVLSYCRGSWGVFSAPGFFPLQASIFISKHRLWTHRKFWLPYSSVQNPSVTSYVHAVRPRLFHLTCD